MEINYIASDSAYLETIHKVLNYEGSAIGLDVETTSLDIFNGKLILVQIGNDSFVNVYDTRKISSKYMSHVINLLTGRTVVGHNIKFDIKIIRKHFGIQLANVYDTMVAESVINAGIGFSKNDGDKFNQKHKARYSLEDLARKYANVELDKSLRMGFLDENVVITPQLLDYAAGDILVLPAIHNAQWKEIEKRRLVKTIELECKLTPVVAAMEYTGVTLDKDEWRELIEIAKIESEKSRRELISYLKAPLIQYVTLNELNTYDVFEKFRVPIDSKKKEYIQSMKDVRDPEEIYSFFGQRFNVNSNTQMLEALHFLNLMVDSTSSKVLLRDCKNHHFVEILIRYREWNKKLTGFGENFFTDINPATGKIHTDYNQMGTGTGRFASSGPNLQNIKKDPKYRKPFIASEGYDFLTTDYSQIELRLAAELSQDPIMLKAFREDDDLHMITAMSVFELSREQITSDQRRMAKSINFATIYGTSARGLAYNFAIPVEEAQKRLDLFKRTYPSLTKTISEVHSQVLSRGYSITMLGRKRYFILPVKWTKQNYKLMYKVMREGFNHVIQGGSADMTKIAMCEMFYNNPFGDKMRLVLTTHDEVVVEFAKELREEVKVFVEEKMLYAAGLFIKTIPVKISIDIAPYWTHE